MPEILQLVIEPDPRLHQKSEEVPEVDDDMRKLLDNMLHSMYHYHGVGLAAVQVGVLKKAIVIDVNEEYGQGITQPMYLVNAQIIQCSELKEFFDEGCLSFPGLYTPIERPADIVVKYLDYNGQVQERSVKHGLLSVCIQHEIDHTNGKVFVDNLSPLKKESTMAKFLKDQLQTA